MKNKTINQTKNGTTQPVDAFEQAVRMRDLLADHLESCLEPKVAEAWSKAANVVRQMQKDRKRAVAEFTDDELVEYLRSLPERRLQALLVAVQGVSLAGKPLFE